MLASTVQFSNNNQPPTTPNTQLEYTGTGTEGPFPQTPNSVPDTNPRTSRFPHRSSTHKKPEDPCRIVNVPPTSKPPSDTR